MNWSLEISLKSFSSCLQNEQTPLHYASSHGRVEVINVLLAAGAEINAPIKVDDLTTEISV
jgi:ankyrin repeat protein